MNFELYYNNGWHSGPHADLIMAETYAKNLIAGDKSNTLTSVEIRPRRLNAPVGGYSQNNPGSIYIESVVEREERIAIKKRSVYLT